MKVTTRYLLLTTTILFFCRLTSVNGNQEQQQQQQQSHFQHDTSCRFFLAESKVQKGKLGLYYTGYHNVAPGQVIHQDLWIPIRNANRNEWSMWHDIAVTRQDIHERLRLETLYEIQSFVSGVGSMAQCHDGGLANIHPVVATTLEHDKNDNPSRRLLSYVATSPIRPGQELFTTCSDNLVPEFGRPVRPMTKSLSTLEWYGTCMDRLLNNIVQDDDSTTTTKTTTTITSAISKRRVPKGQVVASSPVILLDRSQMEIVQQSYNPIQNKMEYTENVLGHQELFNYCYGHVNSSVLLLPYGEPGIHSIRNKNNNVNSNNMSPNVRLAWHNNSMHLSRIDSFLELEALEAMDQNNGDRLIIDYVATRDILPGEELILDYGQDWRDARENEKIKHSDEAKMMASKASRDQRIVSSAERYLQAHPNEPFRTVLEQSKMPYPKTTQTACWYQDATVGEAAGDIGGGNMDRLVWSAQENGQQCLRPCHVVERQRHENENIDDENDNKPTTPGESSPSQYFYTVRVAEIPNPLTPSHCKLSDTVRGRFVHGVPGEAITLVNKPTMLGPNTNNDDHDSSFGHEIGVPDTGFYPSTWQTYNLPNNTMGDFQLPPLATGQIEPIRWVDTGEPVSNHAYVIGIPPRVRTELLDFCNRMGITERFKYYTYRGNALPPGRDLEIELKGHSKWLVQRPANWKSNLHWISPLNKESHREYLEALSAAGYDEVLRTIGEHFGFDGLACYHIAFISVSHSTGGLIHFDVDKTGAKAFSMIVPLILVNGTQPELALQSDIEQDGEAEEEDDESPPPRRGGLKYRYEVAAMMGDAANHATSSVDYRVSKEMRMAATIYIADINQDNLQAILDETQNYPPRDRPDILWELAGKHWKRSDPSVKLPEPTCMADEM